MMACGGGSCEGESALGRSIRRRSGGKGVGRAATTGRSVPSSSTTVSCLDAAGSITNSNRTFSASSCRMGPR